MKQETSKVGKRGAVVIPAKIRRRLGITEGSLVIAEEREDGVLFRPAVILPIETYTKDRKAELLLNNALAGEDYQRAREEVRKLGLDPDAVPHEQPE